MKPLSIRFHAVRAAQSPVRLDASDHHSAATPTYNPGEPTSRPTETISTPTWAQRAATAAAKSRRPFIIFIPEYRATLSVLTQSLSSISSHLGFHSSTSFSSTFSLLLSLLMKNRVLFENSRCQIFICCYGIYAQYRSTWANSGLRSGQISASFMSYLESTQNLGNMIGRPIPKAHFFTLLAKVALIG